MNDMTLGNQATATSPFLSSYQGLDSATLNSLVTLQGDYHQQAPTENQSAALQDLMSARDSTDPQLRAALIADAVKQLTPAGATPMQFATAASPGTNAPAGVASGTGGASITSLPATASTDATGSNPPLTASGSANTVDTGRYLITASSGQGGQLTVHDKETGKDTVVWGDPHISVDGKDTAEFQNNGLTIKLDDGTEIQIQPTATDAGGHAYINQVAVTKGDQAVTMSGFHGGSLHTSGVMNGQAQATQQAYNGTAETTVFEGDDDQLYSHAANGSMGAQIVNTGSGEVNLDALGAAPASSGTPTANSDSSAALQQAIQNYTSGFMQQMLTSMMAEVMSTSGFNG